MNFYKFLYQLMHFTYVKRSVVKKSREHKKGIVYFKRQCFMARNGLYINLEGPSFNWISNYCFQLKARNNRPTFSITNKLMTMHVPDEISSFKQCEKLLIQRAKCFQNWLRLHSICPYKSHQSSFTFSQDLLQERIK